MNQIIKIKKLVMIKKEIVHFLKKVKNCSGLILRMSSEIYLVEKIVELAWKKRKGEN